MAIHLKLGPVPVPESAAKASQDFQSRESTIREIFRPALRGVSAAQWHRHFDWILDMMIEGTEIANRMELYREIGRISPSCARQICHKLESHLEDISRVKEHLKNRQGDVDHIKALEKLAFASLALFSELKKLKPLSNY